MVGPPVGYSHYCRIWQFLTWGGHILSVTIFSRCFCFLPKCPFNTCSTVTPLEDHIRAKIIPTGVFIGSCEARHCTADSPVVSLNAVLHRRKPCGCPDHRAMAPLLLTSTVKLGRPNTSPLPSTRERTSSIRCSRAAAQGSSAPLWLAATGTLKLQEGVKHSEGVNRK